MICAWARRIRATPRAAALVLLVLILVPRAAAQHAAAQQSTAPGRFAASMAKDRLTVRDNSSGTLVVRPGPRSLVTSTRCGAAAALRPADNGFDLELTYTNNAPAPADVGQVVLGVFRLGSVAFAYDFRVD